MSFNLVPQAYAASDDVTKCWATNSSDGVPTIGGIECILQALIKPLPVVIAFAAVVMLVMAGIRLMNAGSDPKAVSSAWSTFTYALIGIILLSVAWLVLVLIENVTGAKVTEFGIK